MTYAGWYFYNESSFFMTALMNINISTGIMIVCFILNTHFSWYWKGLINSVIIVQVYLWCWTIYFRGQSFCTIPFDVYLHFLHWHTLNLISSIEVRFQSCSRNSNTLTNTFGTVNIWYQLFINSYIVHVHA